jgi:hypothetical protein
MTASDDIRDDLLHWCAWRAFIAQAREKQGWPDPEKTRQRAYRMYEEELAARSPGYPIKTASWTTSGRDGASLFALLT